MSRTKMSISAFARRSLLSPKALRLYDESGLLRPQEVDPVSGYRYYSESQLQDARAISLLRRLDVPLATIANILNAKPGDATRYLDAWWQQTEDEFERRRELHRFIRANVLGDGSLESTSTEEYEIEVRTVPETTYLVITGQVTGPDLPGFIADSHDELYERASQFGGAAGAVTVIYRGIVTMDSDGPVEVCMPIAPTDDANNDVRIEAAHTQAFVRLLKRQVEFPQILQVYQAIRNWIESEGHEISGPPREVYLGPFDAAAPSDPVCDIAFPIRVSNGEPHDRA